MDYTLNMHYMDVIVVIMDVIVVIMDVIVVIMGIVGTRGEYELTNVDVFKNLLILL